MDYFFNIAVQNKQVLIHCGVMKFFGRHALSSRGWGSQDKRSIEPLRKQGPGLTTGLCTTANCPV